MAKGGFDPVVERVREATDIVELIGAHVPLKRVGSRFGGLCPFHQEKTASFYVNPALQAFHCFGCGVGGDAFSFIMKHENMTFPEALTLLAERAGIPLPTRRSQGRDDELERIREAIRLAQTWFRSQLAGETGKNGRLYLDRRGVSPEMREAYALGLSPEAWDGLTRHARALTSERTLIEAGLAIEAESGRVYDRFRHRLMIPIETAAGAPLGFGGRALGDQEPKYLNSPETAIYRKGSVLFGAEQAREGIRKDGRVVVVEGYFDVIALAQVGISGVVGTCGTALTPEQARLLRRLSDRVVLLFDGDAAGVRAGHRALTVLVGEVPEVLVCAPPAGKDPDLWVRQDGVEAVRRGLDLARSPLAFLQDLGEAGVIRPREALEQSVQLVGQVRDPMQRDLWIQEVASRFRVGIEAIRQALHQKAAGSLVPRQKTAREDPGHGAATASAPGTGKAWSSLGRECLRSALANPARAAEIAQALVEAHLVGDDLAQLLHWIGERAAESGGASIASILSQAAHQHPLAPQLVALSLESETRAEDPEIMLRQIRKEVLLKAAEQVNRLVLKAQEGNDEMELRRLLAERQRLAGERAALERIPSALAGGGPGKEPV